MQLARVVLPWDATDSSVDLLLDNWNLDLLQLDFVWQQRWACDCQSDENFLAKWVVGFLAQLRIVHKALFLRPELCVITNAGGGNTLGCMETLAEFLVEHGSAELLIAAVRGENLLSSIEWLPNEVDLKEREALAARAQIGASPLAMALAEGARVIVTGAYDVTAPFLAAATNAGLCSWQDDAGLSKISAASQFESTLVEIETDSGLKLTEPAQAHASRVRKLQTVEHADLCCDYSGLSLGRSLGDKWKITGVSGKVHSQDWPVHMTLSEGYRATIVLEAPADQFATIREFCSEAFASATLSEFAETNSSSQLIRLQYQDKTCQQCQRFMDSLQSWLRQNEIGRFAEPLPSIVRLTETLKTRISIDQITLSVDTRPAREWQ